MVVKDRWSLKKVVAKTGQTVCFSYPRDFEILGCCPARPVLPHGEKVPL